MEVPQQAQAEFPAHGPVLARCGIDPGSHPDAAVADGIVPGGGTALLRCIPAAQKVASTLQGDEKLGAEIVVRALEKPVRTIAENSGVDGAVVADEVNATLGEVRALLEAAAERPDELESLQQVADLLRQVRGVLRVVEVYGGALLAEEMEQAARWLAPGGDRHRQEEGLDALVRAVVQLPAYLERVLGGSRDLADARLPAERQQQLRQLLGQLLARLHAARSRKEVDHE